LFTGHKWCLVVASSEHSRQPVYVYEYSEGYVINSSTGEVVDRIFDYSPQAHHSIDHCADRSLNHSRLIHPVLRGYHKNRRLYARARRLEEKGFVVDYNKLFDIGFKKSVLHEKSVKAERLFNHLGLLTELEEIIGEVSKRAPHLLARSRRGQLALAYVIRELRTSRRPRYSELRGIVSESAFRNILRIAEEYLGAERSWRTGKIAFESA